MSYRALKLFDFLIKISASKYLTHIRFARRPFRVHGGPKRLEGTVKTVTEFESEHDEFIHQDTSYKDFVKKVKSMDKCSDEDIETALTSADDFGFAIHREDSVEEEKARRSFVKKKIIARKYFNLEKETNLLTHAAKEQIRYLHMLDSSEWTPEVISENFPITVGGVKKLLKSNFKLKEVEKIKEHDAEMEKRWESLKAGSPSADISYFTRRMWNEGVIMAKYYNGNPHLPSNPTDITEKIVREERKQIKGEFSSIIEHYVNYKKETDSASKPTHSNVLQVADHFQKPKRPKTREQKHFLNRSEYIFENEYGSDQSSRKGSKKNEQFCQPEVLHNQFKINLKEEMSSPLTKDDSEYLKWMEEKPTKETKLQGNTMYENVKFYKINKYKKETVEMDQERMQNNFYNSKTGYNLNKEHIQRNIKIPRQLHKKGSTYRVNQCVYDEYGEFLYKVPS